MSATVAWRATVALFCSSALTVSAHGFSKSAEAAIVAAGGSVEKIDLPFKGGRPPAKGNQHTNR